MIEYYHEVVEAVRKLPKANKPEAFKGHNYVGTGKSKLEFLDIKLPDLRKRLKQGFSFSKLPASEQMKIWNQIWTKSKTFEVMLLPLMWTKLLPREELLKHKNYYLKWLKKSDNWAISDSLSDFYAIILEEDKNFMLPLLAKWKSSKNPWERRQSLVSLFYYSSLRQKYLPFKTVESFIKNLLFDEHYFVQKGVGWSLRESYNVYPKQTLALLKKEAKNISSVAWVAATEKLSIEEKEKLKGLRSKKNGA